MISKESKWGKSNMKAKRMDEKGLYSAEVFQALIQHERYRTDREHGEFSLVVFTVTDADERSKDTKKLIDFMKMNKRLIDEIGWMDENKLGLLLPLTNRDGADLFVCRMKANLSLSSGEMDCAVYSYPGSWTSHWDDEVSAKDTAAGKAGHIEKFGLSKSFCVGVPIWKRVFDVAVSFCVLFVLWPLFLAVAVYIKIVSPGPVFFRQKRVGLGGKTFEFIKFRSMHHGNDQGTHMKHIVDRIRSDNPLAKLDSIDPRIIPGGRFLRKSCIDELPQIFLVLKGEMSLIGPRPCLPYEAKEFLRWHAHRFDVLPGLTGLWQVSGKNKLTFQQMIRLDITYARTLSLWNDIKILFRTIPTVIGLIGEPLIERLKDRAGRTRDTAYGFNAKGSGTMHSDTVVSRNPGLGVNSACQ